MKLLVVAHGVNATEYERSADFVNGTNEKPIYLCPHSKNFLVSVDEVRETLEVVDAVIVIQCTASCVPNGPEESELQRVERLTIHEAYEAGKLVGVIGNLRTVFSRHLIKPSEQVHLVGLYRDKMNQEQSATARQHFHFANIVPMNDLGREACLFIEQLASIPRRAAA